MRKIFLLTAIASTIASCQSSPEAPDTSAWSYCDRLLYAMKNPYVSDRNFYLAKEAARNHGCLGEAQEQRLRVKVE